MAAKRVKTRYPGIYSRGSRYVVLWRHRGIQQQETFRTLAEAREAQGRRRQAGEKRAYTRATFEDYALVWFDSYNGRTARGLAESTRGQYRRSIELYAMPFFARDRLADIEPPDVRRFVRSLEDRGQKAGSVRKNLAPLKALFATAVEDGAIRSNPTTSVRVGAQRVPVDDQPQAKAMTREELQVVLAALPEEWRPFFRFLAQTGVRISEALGLTWGDVELGVCPQVHIRRQLYKGSLQALKSRHSRRSVPLTPGMVHTLREMRARGYAEGAPVFATRLGRPLNRYNLRNRVLKPTVESVGLGWVTFHSFRHTCGSLLFAGGKDVKQVQEWLGHADPGFTLRTYVHLLDEGLGSADFLDDAVGGTGAATQRPGAPANRKPAVDPNTAH